MTLSLPEYHHCSEVELHIYVRQGGHHYNDICCCECDIVAIIM